MKTDKIYWNEQKDKVSNPYQDFYLREPIMAARFKKKEDILNSPKSIPDNIFVWFVLILEFDKYDLLKGLTGVND